MLPPEAGDDAEGDRAVTAHNQRQPPAVCGVGNGIGHLAGHPGDGREVACPRAVMIDGERRPPGRFAGSCTVSPAAARRSASRPRVARPAPAPAQRGEPPALLGTPIMTQPPIDTSAALVAIKVL
jgi:hypothetical protein